MQHNDHDDEKFEDSEYHFEDSVSFDDEDSVDGHAAKSSDEVTPPVVAPAGEVNRSKRMLIGGISFLAIVVIVYKFVAPTSPVVSTDITSQPITAQQNTPLQANVPVPAAVAPAAPQVATAAPVQAIPQATPQVAASMPLPPAAAPQVASNAMPAPGGMPMPGGAIQQPEAAPMPAPGNDLASLPAPSAPASISANDQLASSISTTNGVQAAAQIQSGADQAISSLIATPQVPGSSSSNQANLDAQSAQLMNQLQTAYAQKVNDFANQNQQLQTQIQSLDAKVATLQADLNKMMQIMTQQSQRSAPQSMQTAPTGQPQSDNSDLMSGGVAQTADQKSTYNVQAIIPGRAWLRAQNGETVTVAEGDMVHDLGRVSKIDPYDGIVEINTGNKIVSLSYGNVG